MRVFQIDLNPVSQRQTSPFGLFNGMPQRRNVILQFEGGSVSVDRNVPHSANSKFSRPSRTITIQGPQGIRSHVSVKTNDPIQGQQIIHRQVSLQPNNPSGGIILDILPDATVNIRRPSSSINTGTNKKRIRPNPQSLHKKVPQIKKSKELRNVSGNQRNTDKSIKKSPKIRSENRNGKSKNNAQVWSGRMKVKNKRNNRQSKDTFQNYPKHHFLRQNVRKIESSHPQQTGMFNIHPDTGHTRTGDSVYNPSDMFFMGPQVDAFNPFAPDMLQFADGDMEPGQFMLHSNPHFMHPQTDSGMYQNSATLPDHLRNNAQPHGPQTNVNRQQPTQHNDPNFMDMLIQQKLMDAMEEMRHVSRFSKPLLGNPRDAVFVGVPDKTVNTYPADRNSRKETQSKYGNTGHIANGNGIASQAGKNTEKGKSNSKNKRVISFHPSPSSLSDTTMAKPEQKDSMIIPFIHMKSKPLQMQSKTHDSRGVPNDIVPRNNDKTAKTSKLKDSSTGNVNNERITDKPLLSILNGKMAHPQFTRGTPPPQYTEELINQHIMEGMFNQHFMGDAFNPYFDDTTSNQPLLTGQTGQNHQFYEAPVGNMNTQPVNGFGMPAFTDVFQNPQMDWNVAPNREHPTNPSEHTSSSSGKNFITVGSHQDNNNPGNVRNGLPISQPKQWTPSTQDFTGPVGGVNPAQLLTPSEIVENANVNFQQNQRQRQNGQFEQGGSNIMQISSMPTGPESGLFMDNPNVSPNQLEIVSGNVVDIPLNQDTVINQNNQNMFNGPEDPMISLSDKDIPNKQFDAINQQLPAKSKSKGESNNRLSPTKSEVIDKHNIVTIQSDKIETNGQSTSTLTSKQSGIDSNISNNVNGKNKEAMVQPVLSETSKSVHETGKLEQKSKDIKQNTKKKDKKKSKKKSKKKKSSSKRKRKSKKKSRSKQKKSKKSSKKPSKKQKSKQSKSTNENKTNPVN